jgi:hypothetical protein
MNQQLTTQKHLFVRNPPQKSPVKTKKTPDRSGVIFFFAKKPLRV